MILCTWTICLVEAVVFHVDTARTTGDGAACARKSSTLTTWCCACEQHGKHQRLPFIAAETSEHPRYMPGCENASTLEFVPWRSTLTGLVQRLLPRRARTGYRCANLAVTVTLTPRLRHRGAGMVACGRAPVEALSLTRSTGWRPVGKLLSVLVEPAAGELPRPYHPPSKPMR